MSAEFAIHATQLSFRPTFTHPYYDRITGPFIRGQIEARTETNFQTAPLVKTPSWAATIMGLFTKAISILGSFVSNMAFARRVLTHPQNLQNHEGLTERFPQNHLGQRLGSSSLQSELNYNHERQLRAQLNSLESIPGQNLPHSAQEIDSMLLNAQEHGRNAWQHAKDAADDIGTTQVGSLITDLGSALREKFESERSYSEVNRMQMDNAQSVFESFWQTH